MRARAACGPRLRARCAELEQEVLARVRGISAAPVVPDAEYTAGLRAAVAAAVGCGLDVLEGHDPHSVPIPPPLLVQARLAARNGVGLDVVLRRYVSGSTLVSDSIDAEFARDGSLSSECIHRCLREQRFLLDRVIASVTEEYGLEAATQLESLADPRVKLVRKLLVGDLVDTAELGHDLGRWHLGVVATGPDAEVVLRDLARELDRQILLVEGDRDSVWAWFSGHRQLASRDLERAAASRWPDRALLAIGEPGHSLPGWRLTHKQARAILPLARQAPKGVLRYAENALRASMLQDDLLVASLRQLYLAPLEAERDGGETLRRTLRAYLEASGNVSSTAAALRISRKTVTARLAAAEQRLGRPLPSCRAEVEAALWLDESLGAVGSGQVAPGGA